MNKAYSFKKYGLTNEIHIFQGILHSDKSCDSAQVSICKTIQLNQGKWFDDAVCLNEHDARQVAAKVGKQVCCNCVRGLYTEY